MYIYVYSFSLSLLERVCFVCIVCYTSAEDKKSKIGTLAVQDFRVKLFSGYVDYELESGYQILRIQRIHWTLQDNMHVCMLKIELMSILMSRWAVFWVDKLPYHRVCTPKVFRHQPPLLQLILVVEMDWELGKALVAHAVVIIFIIHCHRQKVHGLRLGQVKNLMSAYVSITSAYVSIRQHTSRGKKSMALGGNPDWGQWADSPGPLRGHASRLRSFWGGCWNKPVVVPA